MATSNSNSISTNQQDAEAGILLRPSNDDEGTPVFLQPPFYPAQHTAYIAQLATQLSAPTSYEGAVTEHLRMSGIYWSLTALHMLLPAEAVDDLMGVTTKPAAASAADDSTLNDDANDSSTAATSLIDWLWTCYNPNDGSFGGNTGHQGHLLYTLSALQILAISDQMHEARLLQHKSQIIRFIASLQQPDGSFVGDLQAREIDTRFTYCALQSLALLGVLVLNHAKNNVDATAVINVDQACDYILSCRNLDGGFGSCRGAESHAGQVFCCVGALAIAQRLDRWRTHGDSDSTNYLQLSSSSFSSPDELLAWWLCERQCDSGGLNGRPEKQADVCYSWWNISALSILGKVNWINTDKLAQYILKCQDAEDGGIADRPEDMADVFHTFFGIGGLSLLGHLHRGPEMNHYRCIDPLYALPTDVVQKMKLPGQVIANENGLVDERLQGYEILTFRE